MSTYTSKILFYQRKFKGSTRLKGRKLDFCEKRFCLAFSIEVHGTKLALLESGSTYMLFCLLDLF